MSLIGRYRKWHAERSALAAYCVLVNLPAHRFELNRQRRKRVHDAIVEHWQPVTDDDQRNRKRSP